MNKELLPYLPLLCKAQLFRGLSEDDMDRALQLFRAHVVSYSKGEFLHHAGSPLSEFAIVLQGTVQVCSDDLDGNRMIMATVQAGTAFGESLCFLKVPESPVYIFASEAAKVLWMRPDDLFTEGADTFRFSLQKHFTAALARRTLDMNQRIQILSKLTLREKLNTYFTQLSYQAGSRSFTVPFNREDMAAYIGTNRSALSRELSAMKRDGLIDYHRQAFRILRDT